MLDGALFSISRIDLDIGGSLFAGQRWLIRAGAGDEMVSGDAREHEAVGPIADSLFFADRIPVRKGIDAELGEAIASDLQFAGRSREGVIGKGNVAVRRIFRE